MEQLSLVERLGYELGDRLLIINCDDLGSSHAAILATISSMSAGVATNASLMVPCPWAWDAAQPVGDLPVFGIHPTLTSEYRGYRWRPMTGGTSLQDREGLYAPEPSSLTEAAGLSEFAGVKLH